LGKAIGNGYPIAALCGRRDLMDRFNTKAGGDVFFAGTFNGHPVGCAAALATIAILEEQDVYNHIFRLGDVIRKGLEDIFQRLRVPATVAGFGSVFLTYFMEGPINSYADLLRNNQDLFVKYRRKLLDRGVFKLPLNLKRNNVSFSHTEADINRTLEACEEAMKELCNYELAREASAALRET
jgi:glutamate-1-semialdehyde 2,1-aminomutase